MNPLAVEGSQEGSGVHQLELPSCEDSIYSIFYKTRFVKLHVS